jgi:hypothetical protein
VKTSIWLQDDVYEQRKASGLTYNEAVKRGIAADQPEPLDAKIERIVEGVLFGEAFEARMSRIVRDAVARVAGESHA